MTLEHHSNYVSGLQLDPRSPWGANTASKPSWLEYNSRQPLSEAAALQAQEWCGRLSASGSVQMANPQKLVSVQKTESGSHLQELLGFNLPFCGAQSAPMIPSVYRPLSGFYMTIVFFLNCHDFQLQTLFSATNRLHGNIHNPSHHSRQGIFPK